MGWKAPRTEIIKFEFLGLSDLSRDLGGRVKELEAYRVYGDNCFMKSNNDVDQIWKFAQQ